MRLEGKNRDGQMGTKQQTEAQHEQIQFNSPEKF